MQPHRDHRPRQAIALGTPAELRQKTGLNTILEVSADRDDLAKIAQVFKKMGLDPEIASNKVVASVKTNPVGTMEKLIKAINVTKIKIQA